MNLSMSRFRKGFSLVEIMVGLAMGLIAMVVIMQVFAVFEGGKRSTTGGADAQTNGAVALYMIERDLKVAGWGMDAQVYGKCTTTYAYCDGSATCGGVVGPLSDLSVASVLVTDGGSGPDSVVAQYFTNPADGQFSFPGYTRLNSAMSAPADPPTVMSLSGCKQGDLMLMQDEASGKCTVMRITTMSQEDKDNLRLPHEATPTGDYNPSPSYMTTNGWPVYPSGAKVACFAGSATGKLIQRGYSINANHQLMRNGAIVAPEIMDLQVQYGVAPANSQDVTEWVDPKGLDWGSPTPENRLRIKALRVALVARSTQYERPASDGTCNATTTDMVATWPDLVKSNTGTYPDGWQCHRYKVYETIVPLRNIIMGNL